MTRKEKKAFGELLGELQKSETYPAFAASQGLKKKGDSGSGGGKDEISRLSEIFESVLAQVRGRISAVVNGDNYGVARRILKKSAMRRMRCGLR